MESMQPTGPSGRPRSMKLPKALLACALSLAALAVPITSAQACSCIGMTTAEAIRAADLAFLGTVAGSADAGRDPMMDMPLVRYAFDVERASDQTGPVLEILALDDNGGGSCGMSFAIGERWFVAAADRDGALESNLCSGNRLGMDLGEAEIAELEGRLPFVPGPASAPGASPDGDGPPSGVPLAVLGVSAALLLLVGIGWVAFRRAES